MSITPGTRIGSYQVDARLGEGGMGVVFRAHDTKLQRNVALKLLPDHFAADPERLARFRREAQVLAALNHPNIAQIYGLEDSTPQLCIVMELVEGETLADRLRRGAIPVEEAFQVSRQISEVLEAAHEKGIVHRDLKPANIKLTPEGKVKVLDFGLAKALETVPSTPNFADSPTLNVSATNAGMIVGTAAYMSPEQAKRLSADSRSDVFSFGCVLYEMLASRQAFQGETVSEILASVLVREPDFAVIPENLNPRLHELLHRCLEKNPKRRWHAVADLRIELEQIAANPYRKPETAQPSGLTIARNNHARWAWSIAGVCVVLLIVGLAFAVRMRGPEPQEVRLDITTPPTPDSISLAISPDGRTVAFVGTQQGKSILMLRAFDSTVVRPITGTDGAVLPFWSPDGRSIGFFADGRLKRIDIAGGSPQVLAVASSPRGGTWNAEGTIVFAPVVGPLYRISASGGERTAITRVEASLNSHRYPQFLPDGQHFLFYGAGDPSVKGVYVGSLDGSPPKRLVSSDGTGVYHASGALLFLRQTTLFAQSFNVGRLEMRKNGYDLWALPTSGDKKPIPIATSPFDEREGQFSPDVRWVAYTSNLSGRLEVYIGPFGRPGGKQQVSANGGMQPRWRRDGRELFYIGLDNALMSVPVKVSSDGQSLEPGTPVSLFRTRISSSAYVATPKQEYAVSRDGQRFLMLISPEDATSSPITVLLNWKLKP